MVIRYNHPKTVSENSYGSAMKTVKDAVLGFWAPIASRNVIQAVVEDGVPTTIAI